MADSSEHDGAKVSKRKAGKVLIRRVDTGGDKAKCIFHLPADVSRRISVHAAYADLDRSELVARLVNDHLRRYVVSERGGAGGVSADLG